jgi:hypothetical protein
MEYSSLTYPFQPGVYYDVSDVFSAVYDSAGHTVVSPFKVTDYVNYRSTLTDLKAVSLGDGSYAISWDVYQEGWPVAGASVAVYDSAGHALVSPFAVNNSGAFNAQVDSHVVGLGNGQFALASLGVAGRWYSPHDVSVAVYGTGAPVITTGGGGDEATYIVNRGSKFVTLVQASDPNPNEKVTYSIVGGEVDKKGQSLFSIDPDTGALSLKTAAAAARTYHVTIAATDGHYAVDTQTIAVNVAAEGRMKGSEGADTFVFGAHFGKEVVKGFDPAIDVLQIDHVLVANYADPQTLLNDQHSVSQHGSDVLINLHESNQSELIILKNVQTA